MRSRVPATLWLPVLATVLLVGAFQWGLATASSRSSERRRTPVVEAVAHASPAVVSVEAVRSRSWTRGAGSGVIVHPQGYVVTNSHVIEGGARFLVKPFRSKRRVEARLVANEPANDLALLQIMGGANWPYVSLSPSRDVMLGETAIAIGNPRGLGDSITVGIVSAKDRFAKVPTGTVMRGLIQTDASINSGNSGGPLLNLDGELIGINASLLPSAEGIAFAIPSDTVNRLLQRALGTQAPRNPLRPAQRKAPTAALPRPSARPHVPVPPITRPMQVPSAELEPDISPLLPSDLGLEIVDDGCRLVICKVRAGSRAAVADLMRGDVLLEIDAIPVESMNEVLLSFQAARPGRQYLLTVRRGFRERMLVLKVPR